MSIKEIRERHGVESAMDVNDQYSEWSQPALAARLRQSNRDRAELLRVIDAAFEAANKIQKLLQWDQLGWDVPEDVVYRVCDVQAILRGETDDVK